MNQLPDSTPIMNNYFFIKWADEHLLQDIDKFLLLTKQNKNEFKSIFGKQDYSFNGEFRYWVWKKEHEGLEFLIITSTKGTSIEVVSNELLKMHQHDEYFGKKIISFVKSLITILSEHNEESK